MPAPMDFMAHELHDPMASPSMQGNATSDVVAMQNMLAAAELQEAEHRRAEQQALAADIVEDDGWGAPPRRHETANVEAPDISNWLSDITQRDKELRKNSDATHVRTGLPPVRNADKGKKKIQVGASDVEKQKAEERKDSAPKGPSSKQQKYYSYDYFKEWDKYDVDQEISRIEEEEKKQEEYKNFSKRAADVDSPDDVHAGSSTYQINSMTPLEKRMAAKREKEKGNECMKAGEINAAVGFYSKALELVPGDHLVLGNRAQAYIGIKCFYQAELDCDAALAIEPSYTKARYRRGVAREEQGKLEEASQDYARLLEEQPDHTLGQKKSQVLAVKLRKKREAEEAARKAEEERRKYESAPRRKIQIAVDDDDEDEDEDDDGMDADALRKARDALKKKVEAEEAQKASGSRFTEVSDEESDDKKSRRLKSEAEDAILKRAAAREQKEKGNDRFRNKDLAAALRHYTRGLDLLPTDDTEERHLILGNRAMVLLQQEKLAEAESDCSEAIKANPKWAKAWHRRGVAKHRSGRLEEALQDLEQALKLEPNSQSTMDEIKVVRDLQLAKRRGAPAPSAAPRARVQIEEVETDSEDEDVVVITSPGSKNKAGQPADGSEPSGLGKSAPGAGARSVRVVECDDDTDEEDEGVLMDDDAAVTAAPSAVQSSPAAAKPVAIEEVEDDSEDEQVAAVASTGSPPEVVGAGKTAGKKVAISETDSDSEDEATVPRGASDYAAGAAACKMPVAEPAPKIVLVEEEGEDSDEEVSTPAVPEPAPASRVKRTAWDESGDVDLAKLRAAKKIKEEADGAFKRSHFEDAAALYSSALDVLGCEEETLAEQAVCCLNRAACNLQVREYGRVIADCGQVLDWDADNVKAYLRRGLAYEGSGRFSKAAADMREALSIEFASGGLTALGSKAKECLERCKKVEPDLRSIPIPVREKIVKPAAPLAATPGQHSRAPSSGNAPAARSPGEGDGLDFIARAAFDGHKPGYVFKKGEQGLGYYKDAAGASAGGDACAFAEDDIQIVMDQTGVDRAGAVAALVEHKDAAGAILAIAEGKECVSSDGKPADPKTADTAGSAGAAAAPSLKDKMQASRCMEAEDHKNKGNAAFKASKFRSAIMHYSAAIDLDDTNPTYYTNLAAAHNVLKDYENGLKMALAARKADPCYAKGIYRHAQALQGLGRLREALKAYEEGLALMPGSTQMAEGRKDVAKAIRDSESSEFNALAKLKAMKEEQAKKAAAEAATAAAAAAAASTAAAGAAAMPGADAKSSPSATVTKRTVSGAAAGGGSVPRSGAEVKKTLRSMRRDMEGLFAYLSLCPPDSLPKLLSSGLEEEELVVCVRAVADVGLAASPQASFALLEGLAKVPRVAIVTAMLDRADAKMLETVLLRLHPSKAEGVSYDVDRWAQLRTALRV